MSGNTGKMTNEAIAARGPRMILARTTIEDANTVAHRMDAKTFKRYMKLLNKKMEYQEQPLLYSVCVDGWPKSVHLTMKQAEDAIGVTGHPWRRP